MKHAKQLSIARPAAASLLQTQQKIQVSSAAIAAFASLAGAFETWFRLFEDR